MPEKNPAVTQKGPVLDVPQLDLRALWVGDPALPLSRPRSENPRPDPEEIGAPIPIPCELLVHDGPGSDQRHVALEDVQKLGKLIQVRETEEFPEPGHTWIRMQRELEAVFPVGGPKGGVALEPILGVLDHRPELPALELPSSEPAARVSEEHGSAGRHLYRHSGEEEERGRQSEEGQRAHSIQHTLHQ